MGGDSLFCVEIKTAPAMEEFVAQPPAHALAVAQLDRETAFSDTMMKAFVGAGAFVAADAARLKLTWSDCGGQHVKITGFSPATITWGTKTTMTGTGNLDEDVSAANFDLEMKTLAGTVSCKGDAGTSKTCSLPLGVGSLTFNAMSFPIKKGSTSVSVDLSLSPAHPGALAHTDTKVTATATNGDSLFCVEIKTAPAMEEFVAQPPAHALAVAQLDRETAFSDTMMKAFVGAAASALKLTWSDCGGQHVKITGFSPATVTTGTKTTMTGTGNLDED